MTALGASLVEDRVTFGVWAPRCRAVDAVLEGRAPAPLARGREGLFEATLGGVEPGARYRYRLDGARGRPDLVPPLAALVDLGVTALELMPVCEFPGSRNWGYDGVHLFAPQSTYGGPRGLRRLVDACHARGLSVLLDVVYNHLGPEGNSLAEYGPYARDGRPTRWGPGLNFDGEGSAGVRRHVVENVRYWVREFHVDGFRLDAVHAIRDTSPVHILAELAGAAHAEGARAGRPVHVVAESHNTDRRLVVPLPAV